MGKTKNTYSNYYSDPRTAASCFWGLLLKSLEFYWTKIKLDFDPVWCLQALQHFCVVPFGRSKLISLWWHEWTFGLCYIRRTGHSWSNWPSGHIEVVVRLVGIYIQRNMKRTSSSTNSSLQGTFLFEHFRCLQNLSSAAILSLAYWSDSILIGSTPRRIWGTLCSGTISAMSRQWGLAKI